jgi:hypothetical protein
MDSEQNGPGLCERALALDRDHPKVLVERQNDACFELRQIQQGGVACSGGAGAGPQSVVKACDAPGK